MTLTTIHHKTAKWVGDTWIVEDRPTYQWQGRNEVSPSFSELKDALAWIIKHDEEKNENTI